MRDEVAVEAPPLRPRETPKHPRDTPAPIVIERRVVVATIEHDPHGENLLRRAALMAASDAIADSLVNDTSEDHLEFVIGGHRIDISATAIHPNGEPVAEVA